MFTCGSSKVFRANRKANGVTQGTQGTRSEFTPGVEGVKMVLLPKRVNPTLS